MKKIKLGAICIACTVLTCGAVSLFGCSSQDQDASTQVSDAEWEERLDIKVEEYNSFTYTQKIYSSYSKQQANEYGEWYSHAITYQVDNKNELIRINTNNCEYERETDSFNDEDSTTYSLHYGAGYYNYYPNSSDNNFVSEKTKADFVNEIESISKSVSAIVGVYSDPIMKSFFVYNDETGTYDMGYSTLSLSIKFLNNGGITIIYDTTSICRTELTITGINNTIVSVPTSAYTKIDQYNLNKN